MAGSQNKELWNDWACRILMSIDVWVLISGYLSYYQTKRQLVSPLIPNSTIAEIWYQQTDYLIPVSMVAAGLFVVGLWCYSFRKKGAATVFFIAVPVYYFVLTKLI